MGLFGGGAVGGSGLRYKPNLRGRAGRLAKKRGVIDSTDLILGGASQWYEENYGQEAEIRGGMRLDEPPAHCTIVIDCSKRGGEIAAANANR